jgi:hypothetical protein
MYYGLIYLDPGIIIKSIITYITQVHKLYRFYITKPNNLVILIKMP